MKARNAIAAAVCAAAALPASAVAAGAPTNTAAPAVSGTAMEAGTLTTSRGTWANAPTSFAYMWQRCDSAGAGCVRISGATAQSYKVAAADVGRTLRSMVRATNATGTTSKRSAQTAAVKAAPPANTVKPAVTGTARAGQALKTSNGTWSGSAPMTYAYRWQRCDGAGAACVAIAGATASTYTLTSGDTGRTIRSQVVAKNAGGSATATSAQTGAVATATTPTPTPTPTPTGGLHVSGNQLLDGSTPVQFHGVNYPGTEYACIQGWGIFDGPSDDASVIAIRSWNSNVVHLGLNEDCILGINGVPAAYRGANYMNAIVAFVNRLHAHGMYAEISLMWAAPGTQQALDHPQILDADHSPAALKAIANAFKGDPQTIIGLQSEPHGISWACWKNGGSSCSVGYTALGMQGALDAVRSTGATNVVTASGIDYAGTLDQWLVYKPVDPLAQLIAEAHVYGGTSCSSTACFNQNYAPVAAQVPLQFGETGEDYNAASCASTNTAAFMSWADAHGVGYQAWQWNTWGNCLDLIADFNGTAANSNYARYVKSHYATRP